MINNLFYQDSTSKNCGMLFENHDFKGRDFIMINAAVNENYGSDDLGLTVIGNDKVSSVKPFKGKLPFTDLFLHLSTERITNSLKINMFL